MVAYITIPYYMLLKTLLPATIYFSSISKMSTPSQGTLSALFNSIPSKFGTVTILTKLATGPQPLLPDGTPTKH